MLTFCFVSFVSICEGNRCCDDDDENSNTIDHNDNNHHHNNIDKRYADEIAQRRCDFDIARCHIVGCCDIDIDDVHDNNIIIIDDEEGTAQKVGCRRRR